MKRLAELTFYESRLTRAVGERSEDSATFQAAIRDALELLEIAQSELARMFGVSKASVSRWLSGETLPHPVMRRVAFEMLLAETTKRRRRVDLNAQKAKATPTPSRAVPAVSAFAASPPSNRGGRSRGR
jgi:transcriptional regulator with XRE-family HTH domain